MTLYFAINKKALPYRERHPEAVCGMLSLEFPISNIEAKYADVSISPVDETGECYDWYDILLPYSEINELIEIAVKYESSARVKCACGN